MASAVLAQAKEPPSMCLYTERQIVAALRALHEDGFAYAPAAQVADTINVLETAEDDTPAFASPAEVADAERHLERLWNADKVLRHAHVDHQGRYAYRAPADGEPR